MADRVPLIDIITLPEQSNSHHHAHSQVVVATEGVSLMEVDGQQRQILPGQGCSVDSFFPHQYAALSDHSNILVLNVAVKPDLDSAQYRSFFQLDPRTQQLISMLVEQTRNEECNSKLAHACQQTILSLVESRSTEFDRRYRDSKLDMNRIDSFVMRNLSHKITVPQLASLVYLSESQFYARFKQQMSITPTHHIAQMRLNEVKKCLLNTNLPLSQIADHCGYSSQSAMTNCFKQAFGVTPAKFKVLHSQPCD